MTHRSSNKIHLIAKLTRSCSSCHQEVNLTIHDFGWMDTSQFTEKTEGANLPIVKLECSTCGIWEDAEYLAFVDLFTKKVIAQIEVDELPVLEDNTFKRAYEIIQKLHDGEAEIICRLSLNEKTAQVWLAICDCATDLATNTYNSVHLNDEKRYYLTVIDALTMVENKLKTQEGPPYQLHLNHLEVGILLSTLDRLKNELESKLGTKLNEYITEIESAVGGQKKLISKVIELYSYWDAATDLSAWFALGKEPYDLH